ncbi:MAG: diguanylate cyclase [Vampirovibrionales bacterium]|nr:diguanylate cyclase [Vampirovibrionales bacterium]
MSGQPVVPGSTVVLLIHRDAKFLAKYQTLLEHHGFVVVAANDGSEGLKNFYAHRPHLIISDIILPEINGYQICRLLKNDPVTRNIPFILISDFSEKIEKFWGIRAGADLFLNYGELDIKLVNQIRILLEMYGQTNGALSFSSAAQAVNTDTSTLGMMTRLNQILDKTLIESTLMIECRNFADLAYEPNLLNHMLTSFLENIVDYDALAIFYNDKTKSPRSITFHVPEDKVMNLSQIETMKQAFFDSLPEVYKDLPHFRTQETEVIGVALESDDAEVIEFKTVYSKFFFDKGDMIGAAVFYAKDKVDYPQIFPMPLIEQELSLLMKVRHIFSQAELLAVSDSLTGLMNYSQFLLMMEREFKASKRYANPLTLAIIDIDDFGEYVAKWGYLQGDEVLRLVAAEADDTFRSVDFVGRLSGEKIAVLFPKTDRENAMLALERFQENIGQLIGTLSPITVSIGVATLSEEITNVSELFSAARAALTQSAASV